MNKRFSESLRESSHQNNFSCTFHFSSLLYFPHVLYRRIYITRVPLIVFSHWTLNKATPFSAPPPNRPTSAANNVSRPCFWPWLSSSPCRVFRWISRMYCKTWSLFTRFVWKGKESTRLVLDLIFELLQEDQKYALRVFGWNYGGSEANSRNQ